MVALAGPALLFGVLAVAGLVAVAFGFVLLLARRRQPGAEGRRTALGVPLLVGGLALAVVAFVRSWAGSTTAAAWFNLEYAPALLVVALDGRERLGPPALPQRQQRRLEGLPREVAADEVAERHRSRP